MVRWGSNETSQDATAVTQVDDDSSNQGGRTWHGEKGLACGDILKVWLEGLPDELDVEGKRKRGIEMTPRILSVLSNWKDEVAIH